MGRSIPQGFSGSASFDRRKEWKEQAHIYPTTYPLIRNDIKNNAFPRDYFDAVVLDEVHNVKNLIQAIHSFKKFNC